MKRELSKIDLLVQGDVLARLDYGLDTDLNIEKILDIVRREPGLGAELLSYGNAPIVYMGSSKDVKIDGRSLGMSFDRSADYSTVFGDNVYGKVLEEVRDRYRRELREDVINEVSVRRGQVISDYSPVGSYQTKIEARESEGERFIHTDVYRPSRNARPKFDVDKTGTTGHSQRRTASDVSFQTFECPFGTDSRSKVRVDSAAEVSFLYEKALRNELDWKALFADLHSRGNLTVTGHQEDVLIQELNAQFKWMREEISRNIDLSKRPIVASTLVAPDGSLGRSVYDQFTAPSPAHVLARYINNPLLLYATSENGVLRALDQADKNEAFRFSRINDVDSVNILVIGSDTIGGREPGTRATKTTKKTKVVDNGGYAVMKDGKPMYDRETSYEMQFKTREEVEQDYAAFSARLDDIIRNIEPEVKINFITGTGVGTPRMVQRYVADHKGEISTWDYNRKAPVRSSNEQVDADSRFRFIAFSNFDDVCPVLVGEEKGAAFYLDPNDIESEVSFSRDHLSVDGLACFTVDADRRDAVVRERASLALSNGIPVVHVMNNSSEQEQRDILNAESTLSKASLFGDMDFTSSLFAGDPKNDWSVGQTTNLGVVYEDVAVPFVFNRNVTPVYVNGMPLTTVYGAYAAFVLNGMGKADFEAVQELVNNEDGVKDVVATFEKLLGGEKPSDELVESSMRRAVHLMAHSNLNFADTLVSTGETDIVETVSMIEDRTLFTGMDGQGENRFGVILMAERTALNAEREAQRVKAEAERRAVAEENIRLQRRNVGHAPGEMISGGIPNTIDQSKGAIWFLGTNRPLGLTLPETKPSFEYWNEEFGSADPLTREKASRALIDDGVGGKDENNLVFLFPSDLKAVTGKRKVYNSPDGRDLTGVRRTDPRTGESFVCAYGIPVKNDNEYYEFGNKYGMPTSYRLDKDSAAFVASVVNADSLARETAMAHGMALSFAVTETASGEIRDNLTRVFRDKIWDYPRAKKVDEKTGREYILVDEITKYEKAMVDNPHRSASNEATLKRYMDVLTKGQSFPLNCLVLPSDDYTFPEGDIEAKGEAERKFMADLNFTLQLANANAVAQGLPMRFPLDENKRIDLGPNVPEEFRKMAEDKINSMIGVVKEEDLINSALPKVDRVPLYKVISREQPLERCGTEFYIRPNDLMTAFGEFRFDEILRGMPKMPLHEMAFIFEDGTRLKLTDAKTTKGLSAGEINKYLRYEKNDESRFIVHCSDPEKAPYLLNVIKSYTERAKRVQVETRLVKEGEKESLDLGLEGFVNLLSSNSREVAEMPEDISPRGPVSAIEAPNRFDGTDNDNEYFGWKDAGDGFRGYAQIRYLLPDGTQSAWSTVTDKELSRNIILSSVGRKYNSDTWVVPTAKVLEAQLKAEAIKRAGISFRECEVAAEKKQVDSKIVDISWDDSKEEVKADAAVNEIGRMHFYDGKITPAGDVVFVFGSNPEGRHGKGAAKVAVESFGAVYGQGEGLQGHSYALPTKDLRIKENNGFRSISEKDIVANISKMYECARQNPDRQFMVAYTNAPEETTLNGYSGREMAAMFLAAGSFPENVRFSSAWKAEMERQISGVDIEEDKEQKLYVSYYGGKSLPKDAYIVQISNSCPKGMEPDARLVSAYPSYNDMVNPHKKGEIDDNGYASRYNSQVLVPNRDRILSEVEQIRDKAGDRDVYFMCYEKPGDFCHRYLFSNFLNENGVACEENPADRMKYTAGRVVLFGEEGYEPFRQAEPQHSIVFTESKGSYAQRTRENATAPEVDFTVAFAKDFNTAGEVCTAKAAGDSLIEIHVPYTKDGHIDLSPAGVRKGVNELLSELPDEFYKGKDVEPCGLNIAGNGIYTLGVPQSEADEYVAKVLAVACDKGLKPVSFRSGGQSGIDEAGAVAGQVLGIPTTVHAPAGYAMRGSDNKDIRSEAAFKQRFDSKDYAGLKKSVESFVQELHKERKQKVSSKLGI